MFDALSLELTCARAAAAARSEGKRLENCLLELCIIDYHAVISYRLLAK
jgi:hypothetical protein